MIQYSSVSRLTYRQLTTPPPAKRPSATRRPPRDTGLWRLCFDRLGYGSAKPQLGRRLGNAKLGLGVAAAGQAQSGKKQAVKPSRARRPGHGPAETHGKEAPVPNEAGLCLAPAGVRRGGAWNGGTRTLSALQADLQHIPEVDPILARLLAVAAIVACRQVHTGAVPGTLAVAWLDLRHVLLHGLGGVGVGQRAGEQGALAGADAIAFGLGQARLQAGGQQAGGGGWFLRRFLPPAPRFIGGRLARRRC